MINNQQKPKQKAAPALAVCMVFFASLLRAAGTGGNQLIDAAQGLIIFYIYAVMFTAWGISVHRRIMHRPIKQYLLLTAGCMLFWIFVRTCKNQFFGNIEPWGHWFWYMFYIPMILIPLFGLLAAMHIGKSEDWRLKRRYLLLFVPAALLIAGILTNDTHGLAFSFPAVYADSGNYIRGPLYYAAAVWMLVMFLACIGTLWYKCRLPRAAGRVWMPLAVVGAGILYCILYWIDSSPRGFGFVEMTVAYCALTAAIWESCIAAGLIPSNMEYTAFFNSSDIGAQIVDNDGVVKYFSKTARDIPGEVFERLKKETVFEDQGDTALHMKPLSCGYVIWQEDLSEINRSISELKRAEQELKERAQLLRMEFNQRSQALRVQEQLRIYRLLTAQISEQLEKIKQLAQQLRTAGQERELLSKINLLGTYIKRRSNLIFIAESQKNIPIEELTRCFDEYAENLRVCGIRCAFSYRGIETLRSEYAMLFYDLFEEITEMVLPSLQILMSAVSGRCEGIRFSVQAQCGETPDTFSCSHRLEEEMQKWGGRISYERQDDTFIVSMLLPEEGSV
ncbi:MAG: histidine kinase N-terminal 7TM domain-containing protein [Candidatus Ornithomonoglobus sp.]